MKYTIVFCLFILIALTSCATAQESRADSLLREWEADTAERIAKARNEHPEIQLLLNTQLCSGDTTGIAYRQRVFPRLTYHLVQEKVKVEVYDYFLPEGHWPWAEPIEKYTVNTAPVCIKSGLKPLIQLPQYVKFCTGRLRNCFGSGQEGKNRRTARMLLESHSGEYYSRPFSISSIGINARQDSAIVATSTTYQYMRDRYVKKDGEWVFDRKLSHDIE